MTQKEKAEELVDNYLRTYPIYNNPTVVISYTHNEAKQCALIAVEELIYETQFEVPNIRQRYWKLVKQEIEKL